MSKQEKNKDIKPENPSHGKVEIRQKRVIVKVETAQRKVRMEDLTKENYKEILASLSCEEFKELESQIFLANMRQVGLLPI